MNLPHDQFCVLPWVSLEASPIGTVRPCCLADDELVDNSGEKFRLQTTSFATIQNSQAMRQLRREFLNGKQPKTCRKCWNEERSGRTSKRMHTLDRLKHVIPVEDWTLDAKPLMFLDLKLGNICNLKCRICGSWSSSTFAVEEIANDRSLSTTADPKSSFHYQMLRAGRWPRESDAFWQELERNITAVRYIEFTGGEPFMIEEHFDLLRRIVEQGYADQIEIHYNTNGTIFPQDAKEIWRHFRHVEIAFSIDDVGARFEYQRSGAKWDLVNQNIELFRKMRQELDNITLQVCTTINVFNVLYLEAVAQWIVQQDFDFIYWNMLHDAPYLSIANLPLTAKQAAKTALESACIDNRFRAEFERIVDFMMSGLSSDGNELIEKIRQLDQRREQNLSLVAPELAQALDYEA